MLRYIIKMIEVNNFKKGIVIIPTQGLGNRLRMMACGYALSNYINLPLHVIWNKTPDCFASYDDLFGDNIFKVMTQDTLSKSKYLFFGNIHTNQFIGNISNIATEYDYLVIIGGHEFKHDKMNINDFLYQKSEFYSILKYSQIVNDIVSNYESDMYKKYIGVHIRTFNNTFDSDDVMNPKFNNVFNPINFEINSPATEYFKIIDKIKDNIPLFIFSNNMNVIELFKNRYSNRKILNTSTCVFERDNNNAIIYSLVEFILLSNSKLIIGTFFSSFSDEPSFLNFIPKITPITDSVKTQPNLQYIYHCHNYSVLKIKENEFYGLNLNNFHIIKYFNI